MKKTFTLLIISMFLVCPTFGQFIPGDQSIDVTMGIPPSVLVEDTLVTGCLEAFNVVYSGDTDSASIGYFNRGNSTSFPFQSGIILASGRVDTAMGPNVGGGETGTLNYPGTSPGDPDLSTLSGFTTHDASILEFDFIPSSDTLTFRYIFASEEYNEYVCGSVNDVFGFFISGPGITGPFAGNSQNIALIPGTAIPVSINTVNNGSIGSAGSTSNCPDPVYYLGNSSYYTDNAGGLGIEYDGLTVPLVATAVVIPCETYHIKLKIADGGDSVLDSGVFIETGFTDGTSVTLNNVNPAGTLNDLYEGCQSFYVFTRTDTTNLSFPVDIQLSFGGTATMGQDITNFPSTVTIPIGQMSDTVYYTAIMDGVQESTETFIVEILAGCPCDPTPSGDTITIYDFVEFKASITNTDSMYCGTAAPATLDLNAICISHPAWFIDFQWNTGATTESITVTPPPPGNHDVYWCEIEDLCGNVLVDSITVGVSNLSGFNLATTDAQCFGVCNGTAQVTPFGSSTSAQYVWSDPNIGTTTSGYVNSLCAGGYTVTLTDNSYCAWEETFVITQPNAALDPSSGILPMITDYCQDPGQIQLQAYANIPDVTFEWNNGGVSSNTLDVNPFIGVNVFYVEIQDFCGFSVTDTVTINVSNVENSNINITNATCYGLCDGQVSVMPTGIPPYTYYWGSNNQGSFTTTLNYIDSMCADTMSVTILDNIGCDYTEDFEIFQPDEFDPNQSGLILTDTMWCGVNPPAQVPLSGYSNLLDANYQWSTGATTSTIYVNPQQGTQLYSLTISDNCGNSKVEQVHIIVSTLQSINLNTDSATCYNTCDGAIEIQPQGGNTPFVFNWSANAGGTPSSGIITNMCQGTYQVTVIDDGGCELTSGFEITGPDSLSFCKITNTETMFCGVSAPASITLQTYVNTAVDFEWSTGAISPNFTFSPVDGANIYWVDFTDNCGNTHRDSIIVSVSDLAGALVIPSIAICYGDCNGQAMVNPIGGLTPYSFEWTVPGIGTTTTGHLTELCAGSYTVSVYDQALCLVEKDFAIEQPDSITFSITKSDSHGNNCDGFATVNNTEGGNGSPYSFQWNDPDNTTTYNASSLCPGKYTVTVSDAQSCFSVDTVEIEDIYGINEVGLNSMVQVFPNPNSDGNFNISISKIANQVQRLEVYDVSGKLIYLENIENLIGGIIELKEVPLGVNMLRITLDSGETIVKKLIVME